MSRIAQDLESPLRPEKAFIGGYVSLEVKRKLVELAAVQRLPVTRVLEQIIDGTKIAVEPPVIVAGAERELA